MKKINNNNKFRGNAVYSLNYKFDSVSPAGKCSGTALDLIKRYNELAKEAQNNGDYVGMEVFRQYAEHYRKIVTEINERKYQTRDNTNNNATTKSNEAEAEPVADNGLVETESAEQPVKSENTETENTNDLNKNTKIRRRRNFTVVATDDAQTLEMPTAETEPIAAETKTEVKPQRRHYVRKTKAATDKTETPTE